jgi:hypothetical protein
LGSQILTQDFQLSKAQLDVFQWRRRAAVLQLKLESQQEDLDHLQVYHKILSAEFASQEEALKATETSQALLKVCRWEHTPPPSPLPSTLVM